MAYRAGDRIAVRRIATGHERELILAPDVQVSPGPVDGGRMVLFRWDRASGLQEYLLLEIEPCRATELRIRVSTSDPIIGYSKVSAVSLSGERLFYAIFRGTHGSAMASVLALPYLQQQPIAVEAKRIFESASDGERVAWLQEGSAGASPEIATWNATGVGQRFALPANAAPTGLSLSGARAVWTDRRGIALTVDSTMNEDVYLVDFATGETRQLTTDHAPQNQPSILGRLVAWSDGRDGGSDIRLLDLESGEERVAVATLATERSPTLTAAGLFWMVTGTRGGELYLDPRIRP